MSTLVTNFPLFQELEKIFASCSGSSAKVANPKKEDRLLRDDMSCMKCDRKFPLIRAAIRLRSSTVSSPLLKGNAVLSCVNSNSLIDALFIQVNWKNILSAPTAQVTWFSPWNSSSSKKQLQFLIMTCLGLNQRLPRVIIRAVTSSWHPMNRFHPPSAVRRLPTLRKKEVSRWLWIKSCDSLP